MAETTRQNKTVKKTVTKKNDTQNTEVVNDKVENNSLEVADLLKQIEELKAQLEEQKEKETEQAQTSAPVQQGIGNITYISSQMDRPCTLIHMLECNVPGLETEINVNGVPYTFSRFGEKKIFRFQDMQQIISKYRKWFRYGWLMLGDDCEDLCNDFGLEVSKFPMTVEQYRKMESIPIETFERIVNDMNSNQRALLAQTWMNRYNENKKKYNNMEKIKVLDKATNGLMKPFIKKISGEE